MNVRHRKHHPDRNNNANDENRKDDDINWFRWFWLGLFVLGVLIYFSGSDDEALLGATAPAAVAGVTPTLSTLAAQQTSPSSLSTSSSSLSAADAYRDAAELRKLEPVLDFVRGTGGRIDFTRVRIAASPFGVALLAARDLDVQESADRGNPAVLIPISAMLAPNSRELLPESRAAVARCCSGGEALCDRWMQAAAAVAVELHAGSRSHWWPYLNYLANEKSVDGRGPWTLTNAGSDAELALLSEVGADVAVAAVGTERARWANAVKWCDVPEKVFAVGASIVTSRAFSMQEKRLAGSTEDVNENTDKYVDTLIPVIDMANHRYSAVNDYVWVRQPNAIGWWPGGLPLKAGEEIFDSYGPKASAELLCSYGFVEDKSIYDYVELIAHLGKDDTGAETTWQCCLRPTYDMEYLPKLFVRSRTDLQKHLTRARERLVGLKPIFRTDFCNMNLAVRRYVENVVTILTDTIKRIDDASPEHVQDNCSCPVSRWSMFVTVHSYPVV